ncbi:type I DNA topoisomerase [Clostridiaceae bacterium M8S5]|nr:type I DNA topoisomerase [Clostridiaceae bacterium M8S5]
MAKTLVIVESPAKAKTIGKFLGSKYKIKASVGHVRDLPKSKLGIDIEDEFRPRYITIRGKGEILSDLKREVKKADKVLLATDPDREGEAISWHLANALKIDETDSIRIEFNEITKTAIKKAVKNPRKINNNLVDAQQARRILDRLVGYKISPLLWKKIRKGLSAGRVQSVATKLICDREKEIGKFKPEEYWTISAILKKGKSEFDAFFIGTLEEGKVKKLELKNEADAKKVLDGVNKEDFLVLDIKKSTKKRNPYKPYTTSSLQQDAFNRLNFATKKTMRIAQQLYEGIDLKKKEGTVGLISYIRTDSTRISDEAAEKVKEYILSELGEEYYAKVKKVEKKAKKDIQDAHECIRPTYVDKTPASIKEHLSRDQYRLYSLIWQRFVASQMSPSELETTTIKTKSNEYVFKSNYSKLLFDGFTKIYKINSDDKKVKAINVEKDEKLKAKEVTSKQHFTQPPPRFSEATLVKTMEELGIGRPATYAPIISTILGRNYIVLENKYLAPTELGFIVTDLLEDYFKNIVNEEFTAKMEQDLDKVEAGQLSWIDVVANFYDNFKNDLEVAEKEIEAIEIKDEETDVICDKCGRNMVIKHGRYGKFLACPGYPECKNTKPLVKDIGVKCPKCDGDIVQRRSKRGRTFYGCSNYPECDFVTWNIPVKEKCPSCSGILVKKGGKKGEFLECIDCKTKVEQKQDNG